MKKVVLLIAILLLCSCDYDGEIKKTLSYPPIAYHFTYEGHNYIEFGASAGGVVHDPNCPCMIDYD